MMANAPTTSCGPTGCNRKKACAKLAGLCAAALTLLTFALVWFDGHDLSRFKDKLSLWTILALVLVANLGSVLVFMMGVAAWRWVRRDWRPDVLDDAS
jgi:hypothetical protein